jgi:GNAT superfamily N-acetyltransferase
MNIQILRANPADHIELTQLARASKCHWGYPEHTLTTWEEQLRITPRMIEEYQVYKALAQDVITAFYILIIKADKALLDHFWVRPEFIGQGIGRILFEHAMQKAAGLGARTVEIESDPNAVGFYLKMGATQVGSRLSSFDRQLPVLIVEVDRAGF